MFKTEDTIKVPNNTLLKYKITIQSNVRKNIILKKPNQECRQIQNSHFIKTPMEICPNRMSLQNIQNI